MEPFAINQVEITKELFNEGAQQILTRKYNLLAKKIAVALFVVLIILAVLSRIMSGGFSMLIGEIVIFLAVLGWIRFYLPRNERKRSYQTMLNNCGGTAPRREVLFYDGSLTVHPQEGKPISVPYGDIVGIRSTKHLLILTCENGSEILLDKQGFTLGSAKQIEEMLG